LKLILSILFLSICSTAAFADSPPPIKKVPFLAHMLDHKNIGCPENSSCNKETGALRQKWLDRLRLHAKDQKVSLEAHRKKYGIPINVWTRQDAKLTGPFIHWDSHCKQHRKSLNPILLSQVITKNLGTLAKKYQDKSGLIISKAFLQGTGNIKNYQIPRGERPLYIRSGKLGFTIEEEGHYFGIEFNSNGSFKITKTLQPKNFPQDVACPSSLIEYSKTQNFPKNLYQELYCIAVWDVLKKKFQTIMVGWSCS
jgi:hypothetical protein